MNPVTFYNYVKKGGRWDYKNLNQSNERVSSGELKEHILGIAFYRKDTETNPNADLGDTQFSFGDANARAEDLNNFNFGVTGKATGLFPEATLLQFAGTAEVLKYAEQGKTVPEGWNPVKQTPRGPILFPPYGDNPIDHQWIKNGFKYYRENRRDLDGDWW